MTLRTCRRPRTLRSDLGLLIVLCAYLIIGARPAQAGYYWISPQSQTGSVTVTPSGGSGSSESLDDTDGSWSSQEMFSGTISYSYTGTLLYAWIPAYVGDTPTTQERALTLNGSSTIPLDATSGGYEYSASASASVTMLGETHSRSGTNTSHYPDPADTVITGNLGKSFSQGFTLNVDEGTIEYTVTGSLNTGANGVFQGQLQVAPPATSSGASLAIKNPVMYQLVPLHPSTFYVTVFYNTGSSSGQYRVRIDVAVGGGPPWTVKGAPTVTPRAGKVSHQISMSTAAACQMRVELEKNVGGSWQPQGIFSDTISFTPQ